MERRNARVLREGGGTVNETLMVLGVVVASGVVWLIWELARRNRELTVENRRQREYIAEYSLGLLDDGEVKTLTGNYYDDRRTLERWYEDHPGVNPNRERGGS